MAKKRKTRSEKIAGDIRQQKLSSSPTPSLSISLNDIGINPQPIKTNPTHSISHEYEFVKHDLIKTSTITGAIILVELVLFFVVKL
ncbi:hypothetical protein BH09PAT1_BH09PAT1_3710 [soil metagenome]